MKHTDMIKTIQTLVFAMVLVGQEYAHAEIILNPPGVGIGSINEFEPIGNSFRAEDPSVIVALYIKPINPQENSIDPILFELFPDVGTKEAAIFSESFNIQPGFEGFYDVDVSHIPLTVGNDYTFTASVIGISAYWGIVVGQSGDIGEAIYSFDGSLPVEVFGDNLALRVTPVPLPFSGMLLLSGLTGLGFRRKAA